MSQSEKVAIQCHGGQWYGGCGRAVTLRTSKVHEADYDLCHSKQVGAQCDAQCETMLPVRQAGKVRAVDMHAAGSFWGYFDEWPDAETSASVIHVREILSAGITQLAIEHAKQCN